MRRSVARSAVGLLLLLVCAWPRAAEADPQLQQAAGAGANARQTERMIGRRCDGHAYPRGLAARPLTLPAHTLEVHLPYIGRFGERGYFNESGYPATPAVRWSLTDCLELRHLGLYYDFAGGRRFAPEFGAGVAFSGVGYSAATGIALLVSTWIDLKEHLGETFAVS